MHNHYVKNNTPVSRRNRVPKVGILVLGGSAFTETICCTCSSCCIRKYTLIQVRTTNTPIIQGWQDSFRVPPIHLTTPSGCKNIENLSFRQRLDSLALYDVYTMVSAAIDIKYERQLNNSISRELSLFKGSKLDAGESNSFEERKCSFRT